VVLKDRYGTSHVASALSDGTLRFLALTVMEADPHGRSLLCLEEPENGRHPQRIAAVIELLEDIAVDSSLPVDSDNPLRQVIIDTHSPSVVACVDEGALLAAREVPAGAGDSIGAHLHLGHLANTWRSKVQPEALHIQRGDLIAYLDPLAAIDGAAKTARARVGATLRVYEREDAQLSLRLAGGSQ